MLAMDRRALLAGSASSALALLAPRAARADDMTGVSATEIKIGSTTSLSGPVSALGVQARCQDAFFRMINESGGIAGRKITYIYYDDGFSPPKTLEQVRRLLEQDQVSFLFNMLGTAPNSAVVKYVNAKKVPHLFLSVNGDKWGNYKENPWTMGFAPSARIESQIYTKYMLQQKPDAKIAILYQNDDLGKDYVGGVRDVLGSDFDKRVTAIAHEAADPTVDSQLVSLRASGADMLLSGTTAKFVAQSIRKAYDLQWKATHFIASGGASITGVLIPAGPERAVGVISSAYVKDASDPAWASDPGIGDYLAFMKKYFPDGNPHESYNTYAYTVAKVLMQVLTQCDGHFSRENIMKQASNLKDMQVPTMLPGIKVNTSPTNYHPLRQVQLQRFDGTGWKRFGNIIEGADI
ncbi:ABC transporter substrate-binding protein [Chelatococcus reniformis]|uniref:Branched-chain amino acid ABC transporter substrate-binding protein n=1 Tax=Chelatococcus reniformis TaxID=1494448 RepID=A0A916U224_9HYPH|nr:ABC transporter substrate-binding protein [Chelatococcus reniformis]GGC53773.1 branched-chain amino acid ABC transporter substrate-binding protein [Chelatococcus reniformis]